jgi:DNA-binding NarL/FixJ family response regulator
VARHLGISERTVKVRLHNAYCKLHIRHRMELLLGHEAESSAA